MRTIKIQFEVRYSTILDFKDVYKPIISPYLKLADFFIENTDTIQEYITLRFKDERCSIDTRWDRIIFISESERSDLYDPSGTLFYFFEILGKISKLNSFGKFLNVVLAQWNLIEIEMDRMEIVKEFKEKRLGNLLPYMEDFGLNDLAINLEFKTEKKSAKINYGPFNPDSDIRKFKLFTQDKLSEEEFKKKNGILIESLLFEESSIVDIDLFKRFVKRMNSALKTVSVT